MNLKQVSDKTLKADFLILKNKRDELSDADKEETATFKECDKMVKKYATELDRRDPPKPLTNPGAHLNSGSKSYTRNSSVFGSFGEQLKAIRDAGVPGGRVDNRLFNVAAGLNETTPSDGGFLVEKQFSAEILQAAYQVGKVAPLCRKITIGGNNNGVKIPGLDESSRATGSRWGGCRGYWIAEASEKTASKPKFRQIELELKKAAVLVYATDEMLEDSTILSEVIGTIARDELSFMMDDAVINGSGAGQPLGVLNSGALVTAAAVGSQGAGTILKTC
jgi:HK97 family phage major capsid protein